jgi:hypothetical protein
MRSLIINFAIAALMTSLFTAMVGTQVGMAMNAARAGSDSSFAQARPPSGPNTAGTHAVPGTHGQRAS